MDLVAELRGTILAKASLAIALAWPVCGATTFSGVGAGDMTASSSIIWTRTVADATFTLQIATDSGFQNIVQSAGGSTTTSGDHSWKLAASGLQSNTVHYYRFVSSDGVTSATGTFKTAPLPTDRVGIRFGFSGDADGQWRPYPSINQIAGSSLDFFVFLGDTIYETASTGSPAAADPFANPAQALLDYRRKYLENISPVNANGQPGLGPLFAATGHYTLLDNHETGNKQFQAGGAPQGTPPGSGANAADVTNDVNTSGAYMNKTTGFLALVQAYSNYQPIRESLLSAPNDPRLDGTQQQYFAQQWGANALFVNLDDRSYRDIRLKTAAGADDTGLRADNPNRTMLGATQLAWFEQTLVAAQQTNVTWKFVALSSPIDILGTDGGKSWQGGYRAERNQILKFIADNHITHVVFLTTDDHQLRVNELSYVPDASNPAIYRRVPGCFQVLAGPIGAGGPDAITDHSFANVKAMADTLASNQIAAGIDPIGLDPHFPGLHSVVRENDPNADILRQPVDFYSPDTFNYATLQVAPDGSTLSIDLIGLNSYAANTFPEFAATGPTRRILGFQVDAYSKVTNSLQLQGSGFAYSRVNHLFNGTLTITNLTAQPVSGPLQLVLTGLPAGVSLVNAATFQGMPAITIANDLAPGGSVTIQLQLSNPASTPISFSPDVYASND